MMPPENYGARYWSVMLANNIEVYTYADEVRHDAGTLVLVRHAHDEKPEQVNVAFAPGEWRHVYAASVMDGSAVAVEHWPGQIDEPSKN